MQQNASFTDGYNMSAPKPPRRQIRRALATGVAASGEGGKTYAGESWPTAASPIDNPYCSCKLTATATCEPWPATATPMENPYCSCKHLKDRVPAEVERAAGRHDRARRPPWGVRAPLF